MFDWFFQNQQITIVPVHVILSVIVLISCYIFFRYVILDIIGRWF